MPYGTHGSNDNTVLQLRCSRCHNTYETTPKKEYSRSCQARRNNVASYAGMCLSCAAKLRAATQAAHLRERYGVSNVSQLASVKQQKVATCLKHFGVEHPSQAPSTKRKVAAAFKRRYGRTNVFSGAAGAALAAEAFQNKHGRANFFSGPVGVRAAQQGMLAAHGVISPMHSPAIKARQQAAVLATAGVDNPLRLASAQAAARAALEARRNTRAYQAEQQAEQISRLESRLPDGWSFRTPVHGDTHYEVICPACSAVWRIHKSNPWALLPPGRQCCPSCHPPSMPEEALADFIPPGVEYLRHDRTLLSAEVMAAVGLPKVANGLELDYYFPQHNIAIEINGRYFHSQELIQRTHPSWTPAEVKRYHWYKWKACANLGVRLVTLWADEVTPRLSGILRHALGETKERIGARELRITHVENSTAAQFYEINHLQGGCNGEITIGLETPCGELKACMTFGSPRNCRSSGGVLLQRFATQGSVPGAASRLLAFARPGLGDILSYSDNRYAAGGLYKRLGFQLLHDSSPDYHYLRGSHVIPKNKLQLPALRAEARSLGVAPEGSEPELARRLGYLRVYDCGKKTWRLPNS